MTTVQCVMTLCEWIEENICPGIMLKKPAAAGEATDGGYEYELVSPAVFPFYMPTPNRLGDAGHSCPCIVVKVKEATDDLPDLRSFNVELHFLVWNPGIHPDEWYKPVPGEINLYEQFDTSPYVPSMDGWADLFGVMDTALDKIESVNSFGGELRLDRDVQVKHGPVSEEGRILDTFPVFEGYISFTAEGRIFRDNPELEALL